MIDCPPPPNTAHINIHALKYTHTHTHTCTHTHTHTPLCISHGAVALLWTIRAGVALQPAALGAGCAKGSGDQPGWSTSLRPGVPAYGIPFVRCCVFLSVSVCIRDTCIAIMLCTVLFLIVCPFRDVYRHNFPSARRRGQLHSAATCVGRQTLFGLLAVSP